MNKIFKRLLAILLLLLSPMVMLALFGGVYIAVRLMGGLEFTEAFNSFKAIIYNLKPYFPYLTIIPAALFILALFGKNKIKPVSSKK